MSKFLKSKQYGCGLSPTWKSRKIEREREKNERIQLIWLQKAASLRGAVKTI